MDFEPREFQDVVKQAAREGWTRLAARQNASSARWLVEQEGWPADRMMRTVSPPGLDDLAALQAITGLKSLNLRHNSIDDDGARTIAERLTGLVSLDLSDNSIGVDGACAIAKLLTNLESLELDYNSIDVEGTRAIAASMDRLVSLSLGGNSIGSQGALLISEHLTKLVSLNLRTNSIDADGACSIARNLTSLASLDLGWNSIGDVGARCIADHLKGLVSLDLSDNSIGVDGARAIASGLRNLTQLALAGNSIQTEGARLISEQLTSVTSLDLGGNSIGDDGARLIAERLTNLTVLNLRGNSIGKDGVCSIGEHLPRLSSLDVSRNEIDELPVELAGLPSLKRLFLAGNPIEDMPNEMMLEPWQAHGHVLSATQILHDYFSRRSASRPLNECKILVVGEPGVGKTDLTHWLILNEPHPNPKKTEGIHIDYWLPDGGDGIMAKVWDFGGQEIMQATHQFFLTERSLYLLVLDSRQNEEQGKVRSWLDRIRAFGGDSPVLIVLNKADEGSLELNETQLREDYADNLGESGQVFFRTACRDGKQASKGQGIDALRDEIRDRICKLDGVRQPVPRQFYEAKQAIEAEARARSKLSRKSFDEICAEHGMTDPGDRDLLLYYLKNLGSLFHYRSESRVGQWARTFVLDPEWLTAGVYAVLTDYELGERGGYLDPRDLPEIFARSAATQGRQYDEHDHEFILDMMEGEPFELCFRVHDDPEDRRLVPQRLPANTPPHGIRPEVGIKLRYRYRYLPTGLVPRFIVRTHGFLRAGDAWRDGVVLTMDGVRVLVQAVPEGNYLDVITEGRGAAAQRAARFVRDQLELIHRASRLDGVDAWLALPDFPEGWASLAKLYRWRDDPEKGLDYEFEPEGANRDYTVRELLGYLGQLAGQPTLPKDDTSAIRRLSGGEESQQ